jgi:uncharacterized protein YbjT (DUF2867 family)
MDPEIQLMSGYTKFAVVGAGAIGNFIVQQLLKDKAAGIVKEVVVLTRQVKYHPSNNEGYARCAEYFHWLKSSKTIQGDAKVIQVDYSNNESIKHALTGVDVIISTISGTAIGVQEKIAAAAKEAGVQLFVPSEYGGVSEGETEGLFAPKAKIQKQLKALGIPYAPFYTGAFSDLVWIPHAFLKLLLYLVSSSY